MRISPFKSGKPCRGSNSLNRIYLGFCRRLTFAGTLCFIRHRTLPPTPRQFDKNQGYQSKKGGNDLQKKKHKCKGKIVSRLKNMYKITRDRPTEYSHLGIGINFGIFVFQGLKDGRR